MKRITLALLVFNLISCKISAQASAGDESTYNSSYMQAMESAVKGIDTVTSQQSLLSHANQFERIARAEKNKWEPYYYAAYCYAIMAGKADKASIDILVDKADNLLASATELNDNSETSVLAAMIVANRIQVDPLSRFPEKSAELMALLEKAKQQNPGNPRSYYLLARVMIKVPEGFGGGKIVAKHNLQTAVEKYKIFVPASSIAPNWGSGNAATMLQSLNKE